MTGGHNGWHQGSGNSGSSSAGSSGSTSGVLGLFNILAALYEYRQVLCVCQLTRYSPEGRLTAICIWPSNEGCSMSAFAGGNNGWGGQGNGGSSSSSSSAAAGAHVIDCSPPFPWRSFPVTVTKAVTCSDMECALFCLFTCSIRHALQQD